MEIMSPKRNLNFNMYQDDRRDEIIDVNMLNLEIQNDIKTKSAF